MYFPVVGKQKSCFFVFRGSGFRAGEKLRLRLYPPPAVVIVGGVGKSCSVLTLCLVSSLLLIFHLLRDDLVLLTSPALAMSDSMLRFVFCG